MYDLRQTAGFARSFKRFARKHPELRDRTETVLRTLQENPFAPSLRLHPLTGQLDGLHAVSLTYVYRITLILRVEETEIVLVGIGTHDEVYG